MCSSPGHSLSCWRWKESWEQGPVPMAWCSAPAPWLTQLLLIQLLLWTLKFPHLCSPSGEE